MVEEKDLSKDSDIKQLQELVLEIKEILEDVVNHPRPAIAGRHHKRLKAAWDEAMDGLDKDNDRFSVFIKNLDKAINEVHSVSNEPAVKKITAQKNLKEAGLTDETLKFKLGVYHQCRDEYRDYGTAEQGQSDPKFSWSGWRKVFSRVLQTANIILGSTASTIPGGEYIKEFVEEVGLLVEISGDLEELSY